VKSASRGQNSLRYLAALLDEVDKLFKLKPTRGRSNSGTDPESLRRALNRKRRQFKVQ
jgi:hypothetical protein